MQENKQGFGLLKQKKIINRSNLRESFFQALSNSSWAHYGYLVAADLIESR